MTVFRGAYCMKPSIIWFICKYWGQGGSEKVIEGWQKWVRIEVRQNGGVKYVQKEVVLTISIFLMGSCPLSFLGVSLRQKEGVLSESAHFHSCSLQIILQLHLGIWRVRSSQRGFVSSVGRLRSKSKRSDLYCRIRVLAVEQFMLKMVEDQHLAIATSRIEIPSTTTFRRNLIFVFSGIFTYFDRIPTLRRRRNPTINSKFILLSPRPTSANNCNATPIWLFGGSGCGWGWGSGWRTNLGKMWVRCQRKVENGRVGRMVGDDRKTGVKKYQILALSLDSSWMALPSSLMFY